MGACINDVPKKTKKNYQEEKDNSQKLRKLEPSPSAVSDFKEIKVEKPKKTRNIMTINQLLIAYTIECTLDLSSKMQGPKLMYNAIDGSSAVLRIYNLAEIDLKRFETYRKILNFKVYESEKQDLLIFDDDYCGENILSLLQNIYNTQQQQKFTIKQQVIQFINQVYKIINVFHDQNTYLGNLSLCSFHTASQYNFKVRLTEFNFMVEVEQAQTGFAHNQGFQADWQFFGFLIQLVVNDTPPIYLPLKLQYISSSTMNHSALIQNLLKGNRCMASQLKCLDSASILDDEPPTILGYAFRSDLNLLIKMRRKRKPHNRKLYSKSQQSLFKEKDGRMSRRQEEQLYRRQTQKIFNRIDKYINRLSSKNEESCLYYAKDGEKFKHLKQVFINKNNKMSELQQYLKLIN